MIDILENEAISVGAMLAKFKDRVEMSFDTLNTKNKIYERITDYLEAEGYPTQANVDFKEANINDLVYTILSTIVADFRRKTGRNMRLRREKEIVSIDSETGGAEEFVMMDLVSVTQRNFVVIEAKKSPLGEAMKQCLLALRDMQDNNGGGEVYGFITTGESWQMIRYDGISFEMTERMDVLFGKMGENQQRWIKDYSILVDCMYMALSVGGIAKKDAV